MSSDKLKATLAALHESLAGSSSVDPELEDQLREIDADIHRLLEHKDISTEHASGISENAQALAARLGVEHPHLERFLRELVDTLGRMGV